jgi:hypothetical protein
MGFPVLGSKRDSERGCCNGPGPLFVWNIYLTSPALGTRPVRTCVYGVRVRLEKVKYLKCVREGNM